MNDRQVVVVGAGPAGISAALALKDVGLRSLLVDRAEAVGSSWRARYDRLRLNTCRPFSHLPDRPFAKGTPMFPTRDQVVAHLDQHAHEGGFDVELRTRVDRIRRVDGGWVVETSAGERAARQVVVAIGYEHTPLVPDWPGREQFGGSLAHSSDYRNPQPYRGRRVLVVGPGCSGMEIAYDIAQGGASKVWLAVRTPPNILMRRGPGGIPGDMIGVALLRAPTRVADAVARFGRKMSLGDLTQYGLPVPEEGVFSRLRRLGVAPAILDEEVIDAIKDGRIEVVRGVESLDATGVNLADGGRVEPDAVICATGYRRGLEPLVGHLGVLNERGMPRATGPDAAAPGLRFVGFVPRPGQLGFSAKQAKQAAKAIAGEVSAPTR
ncbi:MAG: NAD(P)/FAD-dependent oxidoreductase [Thermoleophilaceae bacterium]|nr:NAD(P)/FAD-dependent oxidoreductase [Thermoleophilaceae bacterium]